MLLVRMDLRNHRKIVVIDGEIGYTGSMNLVDPAHFKTHAGVGRWVDAMARLRGPAVEVLNGTFLEDWELETDEGMAVTLNVPERLDSVLARHAGAACFEELLSAGVRIARYEPDLLHTKAITVDGRIAVIGSVNIDMRSLWLNFEISLFIYDQACAARVRALQEGYLRDSVDLHPEAWRRRPATARVAEGVLRLLGPML